MSAHTAARSGAVAVGQRVAEPSGHALGAERGGARDAVGVEHERGGPARDQLRDPVQRVGVGERALELGGGDRVGLARLGAAAVADGLLAFAVGPAGAVGDHVAELPGDQAADDLPHGVELLGAELRQAGADVVAEAEVAGRSPRRGAARAAARCSRSSAAAARRSASCRRAPAK